MKRKKVIRRVAIAVAISAICENAYALPPTASPFSPVPPNLVDQKTSVEQNSVLPRVMLLVDDSGSMSSTVRTERCRGKFTDANGRYDWYCRLNYRGEYWKYKSRIDIVKEALNDVLDSYDPSNPNSKSVRDDKGNIRQMKWNMITLCGTATAGKVNEPVSTGNFLTASALKPYVNLLNANCGTPSTDRYIQAADYVYNTINYKCQKNFIVMLSDGDGNNSWWPYYNSTLKNIYGNLPNNYVGSSGELGQGISFFSHKLRDADLKTTGSDVEGSPWDGKQNIQTFSVGFGDGLSRNGLNYLRNAGAAEGGVDTYYKADNPAELVDAFKKIFSNINEQSAAGTAQTTSTAAPIAVSAQVDGLAANLSLNTGIWGSEIRFNKLDNNGNLVKDSQGANEYYPADYASRKVIMNNGNGIYWLDKFTARNNYADFGFESTQQNEFSQAFLPWLLRDANNSDENIKQIAENLKNNNAILRVNEGYRVRTRNANDIARQMGDVLNTNILGFDDFVITGANDGMLYIFKKSQVVTRPYKLILNYLPGGMQRESNEETLAKALPTIAQSNYGQADNPHIYGINGNLRYVKTPKTRNRQQQTVLFGTMGQGGRGAFALRIDGYDSKQTPTSTSTSTTVAYTNPVGLNADQNSWLTSVPLWETSKGNKNKLGYTISKPSIYPVTTEIALNKGATADRGIRVAAFLANGFKSSNANITYDAHPTLYVYDMLGEDFSDKAPSSTLAATPGTLLKAISTDGASAALASPTVVDLDQDGVADVAYAGDYNGNLYRFDLRGPIADWQVKKIYVGSSTQPITAAPAIYNLGNNKVIVLVGTGSDIYTKDRTSIAQQMFMGVYDSIPNTISDLSPAPATINDLQQQSFTVNGNERTANKVNALASGKRGWYINLAAGQSIGSPATKITSAENVVTQASLILDTAYFTTRIYDTNTSTIASNNTTQKETCSVLSATTEKSSGSGWLMAINVKTGGAPDEKLGSAFESSSANSTANSQVVVGKKYAHTLSEVVIMSKSQLNSVVKATNSNGEVSSGEISALDTSKTGSVRAAKDCVDQNDYSILVAKADEKDSLVNQAIKAKLCSKGGHLIRLNLRQINETLN